MWQLIDQSLRYLVFPPPETAAIAIMKLSISFINVSDFTFSDSSPLYSDVDYFLFYKNK